MDERRRQDRRRLARGLVRWPAIGLVFFGLVLCVGAIVAAGAPAIVLGLAGFVSFGFALESAFRWARANEFRHANMRYLWRSCEERLARFEEARRKHRRTELPELIEMPETISRVAESLRLALRRADAVLTEIERSEGVVASTISAPPPIPGAAPAPFSAGARGHFSPAVIPGASGDAEAGSLYRLADRNVAEYREGLRALLAGVVRTEAQAAVFATTLDTLRLRMLGFRLGPRRPELETAEFVATVGEAKAQMAAIDRALDELEINVFASGGEARPAIPDMQELRQRIGEE